MTKDALTSNNRSDRSHTIIAPAALFIAPAAIFFLLLFRNSGIYPVVLRDQYEYSIFSRLLPLSQSIIPSYIYLGLYRSTLSCGCAFLSCARVLNSLFFVLASIFIYSTAKRFCAPSIAGLIALSSLLSPLNSYTAYYMPEAFYYCSFWLFTWYILPLDSGAPWSAWVYGGVLLGMSMLIKVHAVFILPSIVVYIVLASRESEATWKRSAVRNSSAVVVSALLTKFIIAYLFAGRQGLSIVGPLYSSIASSSRSLPLLELAALATDSLEGQVIGLALMFGVPLAIAINTALDFGQTQTESSPPRRLVIYTLSVLLGLALATSLFTASVHEMLRVHMRYYNFAFPLLFIVGGAQIASKAYSGNLALRAVVGGVIGCAIAFATYTRLSPFVPNFVDSPELRGFCYQSVSFYCLSLMSLAALIVWIYNPRFGACVFISAFMPLSVLVSTVFVNTELRFRLEPDIFDRAGIFARLYLANEDLSKLVVVGSDAGGLYRSLFHIDNAQASLDTLPSGSDYDLAGLDAGKEWLLIVGEHPLRGIPYFRLQLNGFELIRATWNGTLDFRHSWWPGVIVMTRGLSVAEGFGTWSVGDSVLLEFAKPLPDKFTVHLVAQAFGPNVGEDFVASVGNSTTRFRLGPSMEEKVLEFNNSAKARTMKIVVPHPISAKELGLSDDERSLGIGFSDLKIIPVMAQVIR